MTPKAVFWDMDGTLVDSEPLHEAALRTALQEEGIVPPSDLSERVIGFAASAVYEMLCKDFGLRVPFEEWIARKYGHYLPRAETLAPRPAPSRFSAN